MNPLQMIRNGGNPQQIVLQILSENSAQNPMIQNLLQLIQQKDNAGIEKFARNVLSERGMDFDQAFASFKQQLGLK